MTLAEQISRQSNIEVVAWLLSGAFSQTYVENREQRAQQNDLKLSLARREAPVKL